MSDWLRALADLEQRGLAGVLVVVAAVEGSAPRDPGARMVVSGRELHGSIGGGRLEHEAVRAARAMLQAGTRSRMRPVIRSTRASSSSTASRYSWQATCWAGCGKVCSISHFRCGHVQRLAS